MFAFEPKLHRIHRQHAIDREMPPDVAQHVDIIELGQPFGIVDEKIASLGLLPNFRKLEKTC